MRNKKTTPEEAAAILQADLERRVKATKEECDASMEKNGTMLQVVFGVSPNNQVTASIQILPRQPNAG